MKRPRARRILAAVVVAAVALTGAATPAEGETETAAAPAAVAATTERLDRGLVGLRSAAGNFVSWRLLAHEPVGTGFNVYRNGVRANAAPITTATSYLDGRRARRGGVHRPPVVNGAETLAAADSTVALAASSMDVPIQPPSGGTTPDGVSYTYTAGDASVDAYKLNGTRMWRIDLGRNIRAGAHYTQFWPTTDNRALRVYSTTDPTSIARPSLMQDRQYRVAVAWQNSGYNQPAHPSFASP
jgi:rhamnogalacturonan endolyase